MMLEETILRRLTFVKYVYHIAKNQFRQNSDIEISRSLVTLDNCVEAYMWIILEVCVPDKVNTLHGKNFRDITKEMKNHVKNFEEISINELHDTRNNIQHKGTMIAESQAQRYFVIVDRLFASCNEIFGVEWDFVSLSILIKNKEVTNYVVNAENAFSKNNFQICARYIIMAFETAKSFRQISQFGSLITLDKANADSVVNQYPSLKPLFDYVDKIEQDLEVLKMGLEYNYWKGYRHELGDLNPRNVLFDSQNKNDFDKNKFPLFQETPQEIENWVRRNFSFIVETILMWEDSWERAGKPVKDLGSAMEELSNLLDSNKKINYD